MVTRRRSEPEPVVDDNALAVMIRELAGQMQGRFEALGERLDETREDAREARDGVMKLTERIGGADTPAQLEKLRGELREGFREGRSDLVNVSDRIRSELAGHDTRLKALEAWKLRVEGATGFVGWAAKHAPWLVAVAAAALAAMGWKDGAG